jgi:uncharacterized SAM-binding protein YcdF (DUF218 family)
LDFTYFLSKAFWFAVQPGNLILLIISAAALLTWLRPRTNGRVWLTALSIVLIFITILPVQSWIARPLENRFPPPAQLPEKIDGIIVLGGIVQPRIAYETGLLTVNGSAERIMVPVALAFRYPEARLVISGRGENHETLIEWFATIGLDIDRVEFEPIARNTYENAILSYRKIHPAPDETWLLVTSAEHMPRAVGVFRKTGWPVIPYPVDYRVVNLGILEVWPDLAGKLSLMGDTLKEWVGLVAYYVMGRSDELFPAP